MRNNYRTSIPQLAYPTIQNVVSYADMELEGDLNLKLLAQKIEGSRFNKKRFPAVIMRKAKPKCTVLCFKSGRMIVIGSKSADQAEDAAKRVIKDISKAMGFKAHMILFKVTNIVANADIGFKIHIQSLSASSKNVIRNENFPGVVYKNLQAVKSILIFASGKLVFTGAKSKQDIDQAFIELIEIMKNFAIQRSEREMIV